MTSAAASRPSRDLAVLVLDFLDGRIAQLWSRLEGLDDDEYLWEPVPSVWTIRADGSGARVDGAGERAIDPAPVTTIAWRMWHLAVDCFDSYRERFEPSRSADPVDSSWHLDSATALADLESSWRAYRAVLASHDDWFEELGPAWGPWHHHNIADMALHAGSELAHHGAEIALLRDLYRARRT